MYRIWQRRQLITLFLLLAAVLGPVISEAQKPKISAEISLGSLKVAPGRPVQGTVKVSVSPAAAALIDPRVRLLICTAPASATAQSLMEATAGLSWEKEQQFLLGLYEAEDKSGEFLYQSLAGPMPVKDPFTPIVFNLNQSGPLLPRISSSNPTMMEKGEFTIVVLAILGGIDVKGESVYSYAADEARVEVVPGLKTIEILRAQVRLDDDPVLVDEVIHFDYSYRIAGLSPSVETPVRYEGTIKELSPPKGKSPLIINKWGKRSLKGHADGSPMNLEASWKATFPRPGDYEVTLEISAPGFMAAAASIKPNALRGAGGSEKAVRKAIVRVAKKGQAAVTANLKETKYWVLDRVERDADMEGKALRGGTLAGVSSSGFTCSYDQVEKISGGYAPNSLFKVTAAGSPPQKLKKGDKFQITISATGSKLGRDKCADGREPGEQASAYAKGSQSFRTTVSPPSNGMPESVVGTSVAVGGYGGKWLPSDSRTYTFEVLESPGSRTMEVSCVAPGLGVFARYVYKGEPDKPAAKPPSSAAKPQIKLEPDEEVPPLEAVLAPDILSVSPRNAMGSPTELLIKGFRPNWKPVQVLIDTVDGFGALRMNQRLKLNQGGSRLTADMWKANDGWFHWNLTALADLGIQPGIYTVPVIVRQEGHGEVRLFLTLRVSARDAFGTSSPPPSLVNPVRPATFQAIFDPGVITLKPGGGRVKVQALIEGTDLNSQKPVEVSFPQSDKGRLPGGLAVSPGSASVLAKDMPAAILQGKAWRTLTLEFLAGPQTEEGEYYVEALVKQEGRGDSTITLTIRVVKGAAQPPN